MKRFALLLFLLIFGTNFSTAKDVSVRIFSNKSTVAVGEMFKLSVEATGTQNFDFAEEPDWTDKLTQIRSEQFMNMSMTNGSFTQSFTISYYLRGNEVGNVTIGPLKIKIKKDIYETNEITINITDSGSSSNTTVQNSTQNQTQNNRSNNGYRAADRTNRNYLIKVNTDKTTAYKNEPILMTVDLYVRSNLQPISYQALKLPSTAWIEKLDDENNNRGYEVVDGIQYQHYEIERKRVFISKEGDYEIPSVVYNFHGLSSSNYGWFSSYEPMSLMTDPFSIKILPLPSVPSDKKFSGLVGEFTNKISIDQLQLAQKDITTLTVELTGVGNFHSIQDIGYKIDDTIDVFSSKNSTQDIGNKKNKKWEILLQPNVTGFHTVTVDDIVYFDTKSGSYQVLPGNTFKLEVKQKNRYDDEESTKIIHYTDDNKQTNAVNDLADITYIKTNLGRNMKMFNYNLWFEIFVFAYIAIIIVLILFVFIRFVIFKNKNEENQKLQLSKNAYKQFTSEINQFTKNLKKQPNQNIQQNIDKLYAILQQYFIARYEIDSIEFTSKGLQDKLSSFVGEDILAKLRNLILDFDMVRYGELSSGTSLTDLVDKLVEVIKEIEQQREGNQE